MTSVAAETSHVSPDCDVEHRMDQKIPLDRNAFEQIVATASILQQLQKRADDLKTRASDGTVNLTGLIEAQQEIQTGSLSPEAALLRVVSLAFQLVPSGGAGIWLSEGDKFLYRVGAGTASDDEGLRKTVLSRLQGTACSEHSNPEHDSDPSPLCASLLAVPIFQGPKLVGALAVFSGGANVFTEQQVVAARLLAALAAHAVDKAANAKYKRMVSLERKIVLGVIESMVPRFAGMAEIKEHSFPAAVHDFSLAGNGPSPPIIGGGLPLNFGDQLSDQALASLAQEIEKFQDYNPSVPPQRPQPYPELVELMAAESASNTAAESPSNPRVSEIGETPPPATEDQQIKLQSKGLGRISAIAPVKVQRVVAVSHKLQKITSTAFDVSLLICRRQLSVFRDNSLILAARFRQFVVSEAPKIESRIASWLKFLSFSQLGLGFALLIAVTLLALRIHSPQLQTKVSAIKAASAVQASEAKPEGFPSQSSHERITDPDAAAALRDLSPFEIPNLRRRARYGDASAAFILGMAYETGYRVRQDCTRAAHWVTEAASAGNAAAEYNLALRYRGGDGVGHNTQKSEYWLRKAAAKRYPEALATVDSSSPARTNLSSQQ
ncbi:MAG: GAF domain-containing protein [Terriglobales bacterium]